jgi:ribose transport system permease protein
MNNKVMSGIKKVTAYREFILIFVIIVFSAIVSFFTPYFFTIANITAMLMGLTVEGLVVIGMVILLISGGLDLSVGSIMAFTGVATGMIIKAGVPIVVGIGLGLILAILIGAISGTLIAKAGINPFITTLGMMMAVKGLMLIVSRGKAILNMPDGFKNIGQGSIGIIQYPIIILLFFVILMDLLLRNTRFMRQSYYVGINENSAKLNGINVSRVKIFNYSLTAFFAGLAGILITARFGSASVTLGENTALNVITAAIIGGASLNGGEGSVLGAVLGVVFMQILSTSLNLLDVNIYWQNFVTGIILILAILVDSINEKRKAGKKAI